MTETRVEVEGAEALAASLNRVAGELDNLTSAGQAAGQAVKTRAASGAPVRTGALARSVYATATGDEVVVGARASYAAYQEYGTSTVPASPYLRPALEAAQSEIVDAYTGEIQQLMETVRGA